MSVQAKVSISVLYTILKNQSRSYYQLGYTLGQVSWTLLH